MIKNLGVSAVLVAAVCASFALGCNKAPEKTSTTEVTSAEIDLGTTPAPTPPKDDYLATVRREQLVIRSRVDEAVSALDRDVADLQKSARPDTAAIHTLLVRRHTLQTDGAVVDQADERGWDELKATVEHDLEGQPQE